MTDVVANWAIVARVFALSFIAAACVYSSETIAHVGAPNVYILHTISWKRLDRSWEHETRKRRVSCSVFRVYRYKHENPKSKHETNTKKVKTRKKHENLKNLHINLHLNFLSSINHCFLAFRPFLRH